MMRALTTDQAYELDKRASADFNIPGESLMGNAGLAVASFVSKQPFDRKVKSIAVVAGKGNNGGDGFSAALELILRLLKNHHHRYYPYLQQQR